MLGLTASIVTKKCDRAKFAKLKEELEANVDCAVVTTENLAFVRQSVVREVVDYVEADDRVRTPDYPLETPELQPTSDESLQLCHGRYGNPYSGKHRHQFVQLHCRV